MAKTPESIRHLACAARFGDLKEVRTILRKHREAARDWRPIMEASYNGFAEVVEVLVEHGADVNAISTSEHNRPLHRAAEKGHVDVVEVLLQSGVDVEARATWLRITPLVKAAFEGSSSIVNLLVQHGAKVDRFSGASIGKTRPAIHGVDSNSLTTLHYCVAPPSGGQNFLRSLRA
jgi:ankyrin repeat protein